MSAMLRCCGEAMRKFALSGLVLLSTTACAAEFNTGPAAVIHCPAKGKMARSFDLSTGAAPWVVTGPGIPNGRARVTPIEPGTIPQNWTARLPDAQWVQAQPVTVPAAHVPGEYQFTLSFKVKKAKRMPQLSINGEIVADEQFQFNLDEPSPPGKDFGAIAPGADDGVIEMTTQDDVQFVAFQYSADGSGKPLGHRSGIYTIRIDVQNSEGPHAALGMLARIKLVAVCGGRK